MILISLRYFVPMIIAFTALTLTAAVAQPVTDPSPVGSPTENFSIGAYGGYARNFFQGAFSVERNGSLSEASDCGRFESGGGSSPVVGLTVEAPLTDRLRWRVLSEYHGRTGTLEFPCIDPASIRLPNGQVVPALTDHVADVDYNAIATHLHIAYQPFSFPLQLSAGPALSVILSGGAYDAREEIVTPSTAEFLSGGQVLRYGAGTFPDGTSLSIGLSGGVSYRAPIGERLTIFPEVSGLIAFTDDIASARLRSHHLQGTLGILYRFESAEEPATPPVAVREEPEPETGLSITLGTRITDDDGNMSDTLVVHQTGVIETRLHPLLTYLFFEEGSATIPERYIRRATQETTGFGEEKLRGLKTLDIYYNLLDIIGSRMTRHPAATITLTGTQPDASAGGERHPLASQRATNVRSYLTDVWKIAPERIAIETRVDPVAKSNPDTREGAAENRRVEIASSTYEIVEPVLLADTSVVSEAPNVWITPRVSTESGVESWEVVVDGGEKHTAIFNGGRMPEAQIRLPQQFIENATATLPSQFDISFTVRDRAGEQQTETMSIPVRWETTIDELRFGAGSYSLILFDFNSAQLRPEHLRTLQLVNQRTLPSSNAGVHGFTDKLGSDELNLALSAQRAQTVAKEIKAKVTAIEGRGETELLYDNSLPEGRFYCRTVVIETKGE